MAGWAGMILGYGMPVGALVGIAGVGTDGAGAEALAGTIGAGVLAGDILHGVTRDGVTLDGVTRVIMGIIHITDTLMQEDAGVL